MSLDKSDIIKPRAISGFPEWLPSQKLVENHWIATIAKIFQSYGYTPLETAAVELTEVLATKGVEKKEIYSIQRLHAEDGETSGLSLHFDLTVPFSRFVVQNQGHLTFPFKRYQIQKVWRGERPAKGRFREFYQCDIDVVGQNSLELCFDAEMLEVIAQVFSRLDLKGLVFRINHRRLIDGFYESLNVPPEKRAPILIEVDKLDKIGPEVLTRLLLEGNFGLNETQVASILRFASLKADVDSLESVLNGLGIKNEAFLQGSKELIELLSLVPACEGVSFLWEGSITRGLNYYTGAVFETLLESAPELGSICSGGRYESLAQNFTNTPLPGVGISIGLTRLLSHLFSTTTLGQGSQSPTQVFIALFEESQRKALAALARELRALDLNVELAAGGKFKKQLAYANKKGIPFIIIPNEHDFELKNMQSGEQNTLSKAELKNSLCQKLSSLS